MSDSKCKVYHVNNASLTFGENKNDFFEVVTDPPLKFPLTQFPGDTRIEEHALCAVCVCPMGEGLVRTVIHAAQRLEGEKGIAYGAGPSLIMDGCISLQMAMETLGYMQAPYAEEPEGTAGILLSNSCWEVWPEGANEWVLTHDRQLAKACYDRSPTSVLQYRQVPVKFVPTKAEQQPITKPIKVEDLLVEEPPMNPYTPDALKSIIDAQIARYEHQPFTKGVATLMVVTTSERFKSDVRTPLLNDARYHALFECLSVQRGNVLIEWIDPMMPVSQLRGGTAILALVDYSVGMIPDEAKHSIENALASARHYGFNARIERF